MGCLPWQTGLASPLVSFLLVLFLSALFSWGVLCPSLAELFMCMKLGEKENKKHSWHTTTTFDVHEEEKEKNRTYAQMLLLVVSGPFHQTRWNTATRVVSDECKRGWMERVNDGSVNKCWSRKRLWKDFVWSSCFEKDNVTDCFLPDLRARIKTITRACSEEYSLWLQVFEGFVWMLWSSFFFGGVGGRGVVILSTSWSFVVVWILSTLGSFVVIAVLF